MISLTRVSSDDLLFRAIFLPQKIYSMVKKTTLKNGLRIVTIPQKGTRTVTVLVLVGTGSKYETRKIRGVSHFLEHMFFKGTTKQPTPLQLIGPMDRIGGMYNAFTGEDYTGYFAKVDADHFNLAMNWVSDIFLHSTLPLKEIEKEKGVVVEELHMHRDIPMSRVEGLWNEVLYGDQPAGWDIVGTQKSVMGLSRNEKHPVSFLFRTLIPFRPKLKRSPS